MDIDIVIPWVDGNDPDLIKKRGQCGGITTELNGAERYRDTNLLKYVLLSIQKFAGWVNRVYIVTDNQKPTWLEENGKLSIIDHTEFIPQEFLPTFNSNAILMNIFRIKGLSEHFILFNDDMILNDYVQRRDFFSDEGLPMDSGVYSVIPANDEFSHVILNDTIVLNKHFNKMDGIKKDWKKFINIRYGGMLFRSILSLPWHSITGFYNPHIAISYKKSNFKKIWALEPDICRKTSSNKFRTSDDISDWVVRYFQLQNTDFSPRSTKFGKYYLQTETNNIVDDIEEKKHKMICINDVKESDMERDIPPIIEALEIKFLKNIED